ncbi:MAG: hypothetical protein D6791_16770 [Chloroflexi bacterium]|nr:MAG: hypothetical protein D6791_16770 [Chloroflexota bacterium]
MKRLIVALVMFGVAAGLAVSTAFAQPPDVRLRAGANDKAPVAFEINGGRVYLGLQNVGPILLTCAGDRIYEGASTNGEVLYTVRGNRLYAGPHLRDSAIFTLSDNRIFAGANTHGRILYTITGNRVSLGGKNSGQVVLTGDQDLENSEPAFKLLLPLLVRLSASARIQLYANLQMTDLLYEFEDGRLFIPSLGQAILFFDGVAIFSGGYPTGEKLFTVDGNHVLVGGANGPVAYTIKDNHIFEGTDEGPVLYTISGDRLLRGAGAGGELVLRANRSLETSDVRFLLPVVLNIWR